MFREYLSFKNRLLTHIKLSFLGRCVTVLQQNCMIKLFFSLCFFLSAVIAWSQPTASVKSNYYLVAHRGGIVDSTNTENSLPALRAAARKGYNMVEVDLRLTKDSVLIVQHDPTFKRYYGVDQSVNSMNWIDIRKLKSSVGGSRVLSFEEVLQECNKGGIQVMIDNKISGNDTVLFGKVVALLHLYHLQDSALMIGTSASTAFFTGKVKLSCTRKQLEENKTRPGYSPANYYLFVRPKDMTEADVNWAREEQVQVVGVINGFLYARSATPLKDAQEDIRKMLKAGITCFQLDSEFDDPFFR